MIHQGRFQSMKLSRISPPPFLSAKISFNPNIQPCRHTSEVIIPLVSWNDRPVADLVRSFAPACKPKSSQRHDPIIKNERTPVQGDPRPQKSLGPYAPTRSSSLPQSQKTSSSSRRENKETRDLIPASDPRSRRDKGGGLRAPARHGLFPTHSIL